MAYDQAQAQFDSIVAMLAAVDVDYDRLDELRELAKTPRFVAGYNMPGYLPDSEPAEFDDADVARSYIADELRRYAEYADTDEYAQQVQELAESLENLNTTGAGAEFGRTVGEYYYWITQDGTMLQGDDVQELAELEASAGDCTDQDDAQQRIYDDPLDVQVRSDWTNPGESLMPSEFCILLCTGGPAVRIVGELSEHGEPCRAWLEYQDWGTPWTQFYSADSDTLVRYASNFFAG